MHHRTQNTCPPGLPDRVISGRRPGDLCDATTGRYDPWTHLGHFRGIWLRYESDMPFGIWGLADFDKRTIQLARGMSTAEARCTLAHELIHFERGGFDGDHVELEEAVVSLIAASRLIPVEVLARLADCDATQADLEAELGVDEDTIRAGRTLLAAAQALSQPADVAAP